MGKDTIAPDLLGGVKPILIEWTYLYSKIIVVYIKFTNHSEYKLNTLFNTLKVQASKKQYFNTNTIQ